MGYRVKGRIVYFTPEEREEIRKEVAKMEKSYQEWKERKKQEFWNKFRHLIAQFPPTLSGPILLDNCDIDDHFAIFKFNMPITKEWYVKILLRGRKNGFRKKEWFKIISPEGQSEEYSNYIVIRNIKQDKYFEERMLRFFNSFRIKNAGLEVIALVINRRKTPPKPPRRDYKWYRKMEKWRAEKRKKMMGQQ